MRLVLLLLPSGARVEGASTLSSAPFSARVVLFCSCCGLLSPRRPLSLWLRRWACPPASLCACAWSRIQAWRAGGEEDEGEGEGETDSLARTRVWGWFQSTTRRGPGEWFRVYKRAMCVLCESESEANKSRESEGEKEEEASGVSSSSAPPRNRLKTATLSLKSTPSR